VKRLFGIYLFLAALWCGGMTFFAAFGARIVLETAPTRHDAGPVNRALLDALDVSSYVMVAVLLVLLLAIDRKAPWTKLTRGLTLRLLAVAAVLAFISRTLITPEMTALRDTLGTAIDLVAKTDPLRRDWGRLHGLSSLALLVRILAAAAIFGIGFAAASGADTRRARSLYVDPPARDGAPSGPTAPSGPQA
jgi:hypothetical protein